MTGKARKERKKKIKDESIILWLTRPHQKDEKDCVHPYANMISSRGVSTSKHGSIMITILSFRRFESSFYQHHNKGSKGLTNGNDGIIL